MSEWPILKLRDAGVELIDCVHKTPAAQEDGYPYVGIPQMKGGWIDFESARKISRQDLVEWTKKAKPQKHDVILSRRTNPGVTAIDKTCTAFALGQNLVLLRADGRHVDRSFLKWLVRTPAWWEQIDKFMNVGAVFNSLKCADVPNFELPVPPIETQRRISSLMDAIDDKIDLNRRMNETLEAMARTVFKDWFVDFGPTRAKAGGLAPYLAPELWELFPDALDDEGRPVGWNRNTMGELCEVAIGGLWGKDQSEPGNLEEYYCLRGVDLQHLREQGEAPKVPSRFAKSAAIEKRCVSINDVLIASSGAGPCGRSLWVGIDGFFDSYKNTGQTIYSNFVKRLHCISPSVACFLDRHLNEMRVSGEIQKYISGTSVPNLNDKGLLQSHQIILPCEPLLDTFFEFTLIVQRRLFSEENATLAALRDLLLPKLMSGDIRLRQAEKAVESVA